MDVLIIAGVSKAKGSQFSVKKGIHLSNGDMILSYANLQKYYGLPVSSESTDAKVPYLAGIYLYNYLSRRGVSCGLISFLDLELEKFENLLQQNPKVIAMSTTFMTSIKTVRSVTEIVRKYAPDIKIIIGGPLVYNSYLLYQMRGTDYDVESCAEDYFFVNQEKSPHEHIDIFVVEEQGEKTLLQIITAIKDGHDPSSTPNIGYYDNDNQLIFTARTAEDNSFDEDIVNWSDVPDEYLYPIFPVRGSRGCPYKCAYCNFCNGRKFRLKDADIIAKEVSSLIDTGKVRMIRFTDDNLFLTRKHVEENCRKLIATGREFKWNSFIRASSITKDNVQLLKESGCVLTQIGMESGSRKILQGMNKKDTPEHYLEVIELLNSHGISTQLYFIVGFPGETEKTMQETINMINRFYHEGPAINTIMVFPFVLAPLAPIYMPEYREKYNLSGYMTNWTHATMDFQRAYQLAQQFYLQVENIHPFYGIEEFVTVEIVKLKKVAQLRSRIRRAEILGSSPGELDGWWQELKDVMTS
jgi:anaerobic magnesium-protoporphyrin IX monomethyl ester cyclase